MSAHSPAPWRVAHDASWLVRDSSGRLVADVALATPETFEQAKGNVALIAAAPDLLAALETILGSPVADNGVYDGSGRTVGEVARAALAKARGK